MIPVGMTRQEWTAVYENSTPEEYLKAEYSNEDSTLWSNSSLPVKPINEIVGGDLGYITGETNDLYFACCAVWGKDGNTFVGMSDGAAIINFHGKVPELNDRLVQHGEISFDAGPGSFQTLTCTLENYDGSPVYQWYRAASITD